MDENLIKEYLKEQYDEGLRHLYDGNKWIPRQEYEATLSWNNETNESDKTPVDSNQKDLLPEPD
jgi:hypothetical protein